MANRRRGSSNSDSNSEEVSKLHSLAQLAGVSISTRTHSLLTMEAPNVWLRNDKGVEVISMTESRLQETLAMMRESYYPDESAAVGIELHKCPESIDELERLTIETFEDGTSMIAIFQNKVVGASFNKVQLKPKSGDLGYFEEFRDFKCKTDSAKEYVNNMIIADSKKDAFEHYGVRKSLELMFLGVCKRHRGLGIGQLLTEATSVVAKQRGLPIVTAIFTSVESQKIGRRLQWDELIDIPMHEFVYRGIPYSNFTGRNQSMVLMAKKLI
ncbi:uncharacterized protein LOC132196815 [Neocloeon triangulifer]|uniref:uncharacterized protein LOC132196815 n=1 Tax=Neocloeon triangulifer TaxID=2078957 RepID=UPI00286ED10D|nr:uncharacterized protein LOC132196815 [Neocloeon triangulifer]